MRFRRQERILNSAEFQRCQNEGRRASARRLVLLCLERAEGPARLGIVVTKKTGTAVIRNRWKRVVRDWFRLCRDELRLSGDHVVIVRGSVKGKPEKSIREELLHLILKIRRA